MALHRIVGFTGTVLFWVANAFGQAPGGPYRTYGSSHGFGNVLFPGTGSAPNMPPAAISIVPPLTGFTIGGPDHGQRLAASIEGRTIFTAPASNRRQRVYAVPYAYPVVVGGWGWNSASPPAEVNLSVVTPPAPQQTAPTVVINQYYTPETARPVLKQYPEGSLPSPSEGLKSYEAPGPQFPDPAEKTGQRPQPGAEEKPTIYLIAFKNGSIYPALAYWVENDTLHYITRDKSLNKASLELIDKELSLQLNRERNVEFRLPGK